MLRFELLLLSTLILHVLLSCCWVEAEEKHQWYRFHTAEKEALLKRFHVAAQRQFGLKKHHLQPQVPFSSQAVREEEKSTNNNDDVVDEEGLLGDQRHLVMMILHMGLSPLERLNATLLAIAEEKGKEAAAALESHWAEERDHHFSSFQHMMQNLSQELWIHHQDDNVQMLQDSAFAHDGNPLHKYFEGYAHTAWVHSIREFQDDYNIHLTEPLVKVLEQYRSDVDAQAKRAHDPSHPMERKLRSMAFDYQREDHHTWCKWDWMHVLYPKAVTRAQRRDEEHLEKAITEWDPFQREEVPSGRNQPDRYDMDKEQLEEVAKERAKKKLTKYYGATRHPHDDNLPFKEGVDAAVRLALSRLPRRRLLTLVHPDTAHLMSASKLLDQRFTNVWMVDPDPTFLKSLQPDTVVDAHPEINPSKFLLRPNLHHGTMGSRPKMMDEDISRLGCHFGHVVSQVAGGSSNWEEAYERVQNAILTIDHIPANVPKHIVSLLDADLVIAHDPASAVAKALMETVYDIVYERQMSQGDDGHIPEHFTDEDKVANYLKPSLTRLKKVVGRRVIGSFAQDIPAGGVLILSYPVKHCYDFHWHNGSATLGQLCEAEDAGLEEAIEEIIRPHAARNNFHAKKPFNLSHVESNSSINATELSMKEDEDVLNYAQDHEPHVLYRHTTVLKSHAHERHHDRLDDQLSAGHKEYGSREDWAPHDVIEVTTTNIVAIQWGHPRHPDPDMVPYVGENHTPEEDPPYGDEDYEAIAQEEEQGPPQPAQDEDEIENEIYLELHQKTGKPIEDLKEEMLEVKRQRQLKADEEGKEKSVDDNDGAISDEEEL